MSLQAIFLIFTIFAANLTFTDCTSDPIKNTDLPKEMPENTKMKWSENGGMAPTWKKIEISGDRILFEEKKMKDNSPTKWSANISNEDKAGLYKVFVDNKFDTIENDEVEDITYDAGSEGVYLLAGTISKNVSYGDNSPLSGLNEKRYLAVARAIQGFEGKYRGKSTR